MFISHKLRANLVGVLIIVAYSMLTYDITKHITFGMIADLVSGVAVICIAILMFPLFNAAGNKHINYAYIISRVIEGVLMVIGGIFILSPSLVGFRSVVYQSIHIYFFILGALFFYLLLYRIQVVPKFITLWGIYASILLFILTMIKLLGIRIGILDLLILPMVLNEIYLAFYLIIKGFDKNVVKKYK